MVDETLDCVVEQCCEGVCPTMGADLVAFNTHGHVEHMCPPCIIGFLRIGPVAPVINFEPEMCPLCIEELELYTSAQVKENAVAPRINTVYPVVAEITMTDHDDKIAGYCISHLLENADYIPNVKINPVT